MTEVFTLGTEEDDDEAATSKNGEDDDGPVAASAHRHTYPISASAGDPNEDSSTGVYARHEQNTYTATQKQRQQQQQRQSGTAETPATSRPPTTTKTTPSRPTSLRVLVLIAPPPPPPPSSSSSSHPLLPLPNALTVLGRAMHQWLVQHLRTTSEDAEEHPRPLKLQDMEEHQESSTMQEDDNVTMVTLCEGETEATCDAVVKFMESSAAANAAVLIHYYGAVVHRGEDLCLPLRGGDGGGDVPAHWSNLLARAAGETAGSAKNEKTKKKEEKSTASKKTVHNNNINKGHSPVPEQRDDDVTAGVGLMRLSVLDAFARTAFAVPPVLVLHCLSSFSSVGSATVPLVPSSSSCWPRGGTKGMIVIAPDHDDLPPSPAAPSPSSSSSSSALHQTGAFFAHCVRRALISSTSSQRTNRHEEDDTQSARRLCWTNVVEEWIEKASATEDQQDLFTSHLSEDEPQAGVVCYCPATPPPPLLPQVPTPPAQKKRMEPTASSSWHEWLRRNALEVPFGQPQPHHHNQQHETQQSEGAENNHHDNDDDGNVMIPAGTRLVLLRVKGRTTVTEEENGHTAKDTKGSPLPVSCLGVVVDATQHPASALQRRPNALEALVNSLKDCFVRCGYVRPRTATGGGSGEVRRTAARRLNATRTTTATSSSNHNNDKTRATSDDFDELFEIHVTQSMSGALCLFVTEAQSQQQQQQQKQSQGPTTPLSLLLQEVLRREWSTQDDEYQKPHQEFVDDEEESRTAQGTKSKSSTTVVALPPQSHATTTTAVAASPAPPSHTTSRATAAMKLTEAMQVHHGWAVAFIGEVATQVVSEPTAWENLIKAQAVVLDMIPA